jgi:hypothetical protein
MNKNQNSIGLMNKYYCYCPECSFSSIATSIPDSKTIIEKHEKDNHKGKPIGIFGKALEYPSFIKISVDN